MGKPSQQNVTSTAVNPAQQAQQPYLNYQWEQAKNLQQNTPQTYYPGQTLAPFTPPNPLQTAGYDALYNTGQTVDQTLRPQANQVFGQAVGGQYGGQYNPAYGGYAALAGSTSPVTQNFQDLLRAAQTQGGQYAQQIGQYAPQMQQQGAQAANTGSQYAQQIGQYSNPIQQYAQQAGANSNLGLSQLGRTASGAYLDPNTNPYMAQMVQAAMDPVTRNYQTSVAPSLDAAASAAGRYGSGTQASLASTAQQNLGKSLSDLSGNLYGQQFARERQAQDVAAQNYGQLYNSGLNLGMTGLQNAAGLQQQAGQQYLSAQDRARAGLSDAQAAQQAAAGQYWQGQNAAQTAAQQYGAAQQAGLAGLSTGFNTGNQAAMNAMQLYPQLAQSQYGGANAAIQAGQGFAGLDKQARDYHQAAIADEMARYYGMQQAPWKNLEQYQGLIGPPQAGSKSETNPYFSNPVGSAISGISGIAGTALSLAKFLPMLSDRRLKEDDEVVGQIGDLPIHQFRYKGEPAKRLGFMADEVERIDPSAVVDTDTGYKAVYYDRALGSALNSFMGKK